MNKLSILIFLYLLSAGSAYAAKVEASDVSFDFTGVSNVVLEISNDEKELTTEFKFPQNSQFTSKTNTSPPTSWIVGLGLCLVFLGYKMKNKAK